MKSLFKLFLIIAACFALNFLLIKFSGILTAEQIEDWLTAAKKASPLYVGAIVVILLFADLFIAIPTLTVTLFAGYFLGHSYGVFAALIGLMSAGICGYALSRYYDKNILGFLLKNESQRNDAIASFQQHGFAMILFSRAMPILPEATACLAGMTRMSFAKFLVAWSISTVPYVLIASYAGSISTIDDPKPAIIAAIFISTSLWLSWFFYRKKNVKKV